MPAIALSLGLAISGCASADGKYPSLALRDAERANGQFEPVAPVAGLDVPQVELDFDGTLEEYLSQLQSRARAANARFSSASTATRAQVRAARGASLESNAWGVAQIGLASLDTHRSETGIILADLDALFVAAKVQNEDTIAIATVREEILSLIERQDALLSTLRGQLR
jgi:hypothetical protein